MRPHVILVSNSVRKVCQLTGEPECGGESGPYLIDRYTRGIEGRGTRQARIYFMLSTWNPYNTVLMTATIQRGPDR